jgi:pyruvate-ferredoxin/flavodoxin oxidoreductase
MQLDSKEPSIPLRQFTENQARFAMLDRTDPEAARHLMGLAQADIDERWRLYAQLAGLERTVPHEPNGGAGEPREPR